MPRFNQPANSSQTEQRVQESLSYLMEISATPISLKKTATYSSVTEEEYHQQFRKFTNRFDGLTDAVNDNHTIQF